MFKSILTTTLRNIVRNRSFSLINLIGLSVSMSLALLIIIIIREQYTYDNFHRDIDRIYRVNTIALRVDGEREEYASTPLPIGRVLKQDYSFTEDVVRLNRRLQGDAIYGNVNVPMSGLFVDPSFLQVFNFPLEKGNPANALKEPNSLVLTQQAAKKLFGGVEPLGQTLTLGKYGEFIVTGIFKNFPSKTHFEFEVLASMNGVPALEKKGVLTASLEDWNNYYSNYVYFKLKEGNDVQEVERALAAMVKKYYAGLKLETRDKGYEFVIVPLAKITPGPELSNQMGTGMPTFLIVFLGVLVGVIMIMACFNYTNLMIAKSLSRAREIGVRKIVGAQRFQVFLQFVGEAVVFSVICLGFSYLLMHLLKPAFMQMNIAREYATQLKEDYLLYLFFLLFAVLVGVVAGLLPAGYLSAFKPARVLKDSGNLKVYSRLTFRKVLIVTQFTLSLIFIIVVMVVYRQVNFMVTMDYGINEKNILNVRLQGLAFQKLANEVKSLPGVVSVGGVSHPLGTWADRSSDYKRNREDEPFVMRDFIADDNYISNLNIKFLSGGNFDAAEEGERERHVVLNEQALKLFHFADPVSAVGQAIYTDDSVMLTVIGVVKDFNFRPLSYQIGPLALRFKTDQLSYLSAKIIPSQKEVVVASIESIWKKLDPVHPMEWKMMEDEIDDAYVQAGFLDIVNIVSYISFIAISLACLGMLGMAMYSTKTRMKEIGVRKVMGASSTEITLLLSKSFIFLLSIAVIIGAPAGYFLGATFLTQYAYKIQISPILMICGIFTVGILGIITIGSQTWRAASSNPIKSLRYE
jgi:putative ABC transport system permease protein